MKWLTGVLFIVIAAMQYRLWFGDGSLAHQAQLNREVAKQEEENRVLQARNKVLAAKVRALKNGRGGIEERARTDMGLIQQGETFFLIVDKRQD